MLWIHIALAILVAQLGVECLLHLLGMFDNDELIINRNITKMFHLAHDLDCMLHDTDVTSFYVQVFTRSFLQKTAKLGKERLRAIAASECVLVLVNSFMPFQLFRKATIEHDYTSVLQLSKASYWSITLHQRIVLSPFGNRNN